MKFRFIVLIFLGIFQYSCMYAPANPNDGAWYTDEFGPLQSNYSMGDFVRYTVSSGGTTVPRNPVNPAYKNQEIGYNIYYNMVNIPYAEDIFNIKVASANLENLYNFVGYLYAGYAALNINPTPFVKTNWLTTFRKANQWQSGSLGFDNNPSGIATIQLVDYTNPNTPFSGTSLNSDSNYPLTNNTISQSVSQGNLSNNELAYAVPCKNLYFPAVDVDHGQYFLNADIDGFVSETVNYNYGLQQYGHDQQEGQQLFAAMLSYAKASCAWNTNYTDGNYVLSIPSYGNGYAAPYGQFFGARLSHILGAVVNDIPESKASAITATWPAMLTGTPAPQIAKLGTYAPPAGSTTPSTAHFGSFQNYINNSMQRASVQQKNSDAYNYVIYHLLPMLQRFVGSSGAATKTPLCSYTIDQNEGISYIKIHDNNVTAYDNGMIVAIANNTGDQLSIVQCDTTTPTGNQIGTLPVGVANYFLHTASMMNQSGQPVMQNMIEIKDISAKASSFVQLMTGAQLQNIVASLKTAMQPIALQYNQNPNLSYQVPVSAMYVVLTNFDVNNLATLKSTGMERIQALNVASFAGKPYCLTLQMNKKANTDGSYTLYPSIVSAKPLYWWNVYAKIMNAKSHQEPLILLPDSVSNAGIAGLQAIHGIWLMSYAAALTEFKFDCEFGNTLDCLHKTFGIFNDSRTDDTTMHSVQQYPPARVVIDASGNLKSGQVVHVQPATDGMYQSRSQYLDMVGCDVWDRGANVHQDIPIVNLFAGKNGQVMVNQANGANVNIAFSFVPDLNTVSKDIKSFSDGYGCPYSNTALMNFATSVISAGMVVTITQSQAGQYEIKCADQANNVYAFQEIFLDPKQDIAGISIGFVNSSDQGWNSATMISVTELPVVGKSATFQMSHVVNGGQNQLNVKVASKGTKPGRALKPTGAKGAKQHKPKTGGKPNNGQQLTGAQEAILLEKCLALASVLLKK